MGAAGVGKTCIITRFLYENFTKDHKKTIEDLHRGEYEINGNPFTLDILDTAGAYPFPAMRKLSITHGDAFVLVYSVENETSFEEVKSLRDQIIEQKNDEYVPIVIVGNKSDIETKKRAIPKETAETTVSMDWGNGYVEASAKDNTNILDIFQELLTQAKIQYALSPAVQKRRESLPVLCGGPTNTTRRKSHKKDSNKRNSCVMC